MDPASRQPVLDAVRNGCQAVTEIAQRTGRHPNTVRKHLQELCRAGLVEETAARTLRRGRPRSLFRPTPGIQPSRPGGPWAERLEGVLEELLMDGYGRAAPASPAGARGAELADQIPAASVPGDAEASLTDLSGLLDMLGFDPLLQGSEFRLRRCPMLRIAHRLPEVSCALHQGLIQHRLARTGDHWSATLRPFAQAGYCTLELTARPAT